ncbi:AAA family ATPase [Entomomonas asaccharolytica]|uniref:AAA family ATPase n=1 Tax=Entomomonas asaccharolytica TaxID=2785331 RepID=A0A974RWL3_9GAMM|nr:AAA family ATPase [Entomomonas asaccharolytica]QQP85295.1 AAA family ATPase [Entomomonas asaccharolytica]
MIKTLAIANFRSINNLVLPLSQLNVITGANGCGKSNLYKALRLLAETAQGNVISAIAKEGGLESVLWAGPEKITGAMQRGEVPIQGTRRQKSIRLHLGFTDDELGYAISLGLPENGLTAFCNDPEIKNETIWAGDWYKPNSVLVERKGPLIQVKQGRKAQAITQHTPSYEGLFGQIALRDDCPEVFRLREIIRNWRFYDYFRTDQDAPARKPQLGTRTPVLHHDGHDLAAALQTIQEVGDAELLAQTISDAFPESSLIIRKDEFFTVMLQQQGILRPLVAQELSDGTLRYLLLTAALLTPRPPSLMVLNEPENSLHTDLLPALARLIINACKHSQLWIISHSKRLINALEQQTDCNTIELEKLLGQTTIKGQKTLETPAWYWPS